MARRQTAKQRAAALDREIEQLYYRHAAGRQINIMRIGSIYKAGHAAAAIGADVTAAVVAAIAEHCEPAS